MKLKDLRQLIREALDEAQGRRPAGKAQPVPKNFAEYRKMFAAALRAVGAPLRLVQEAEDDEYEGGDVFGQIWQSWLEIEGELRASSRRGATPDAQAWDDLIHYSVHDACIDLAADSARGQVVPKELAMAVVGWFTTGRAQKVKTVEFDRNSLKASAMKVLKRAGLKPKLTKSGNTIQVIGKTIDEVGAVLQAEFPSFKTAKNKYGEVTVGFEVGYTGHVGFEVSNWDDEGIVAVDVVMPRERGL